MTLLLVLFNLLNLQARIIPVRSASIEDQTFVWEVKEIEFLDECTILKKVVTPKVVGSWICSTPNEFLEDSDTGQRYMIVWSSLGFNSPHTLSTTTPVEFTEIYAPIGRTQRINISSGSTYYIRSLNTNPFLTVSPNIAQPYRCENCKTIITDIQIADDVTFVGLDFYSYEDQGWVSFANDIAIYNLDYHFSAQILKCFVRSESRIVSEINLGERYSVEKGVRNQIIMMFPRVPLGIFSVNIVEPDGFYWYGIQINNVNP